MIVQRESSGRVERAREREAGSEEVESLKKRGAGRFMGWLAVSLVVLCL